MDVRHSRKQGILVISPQGKNLDANSSTQFKESALDIISKNQTPRVVIDLDQLQFVDSTGLGSLLFLLKKQHDEGGDLKLACLSKEVRAVLELATMHKVFEIFNNPEDAIRSYDA